MCNPALNEKVRILDLGVAICIDAILIHSNALQDKTLTASQQAQHKAKIRENARTYKQALDELLSVLDDEDQQPKTDNSAQQANTFEENKPFYPSPSQWQRLEDKLNEFQALLSLNGAMIIAYENAKHPHAISELNGIHAIYHEKLDQEFNALFHSILEEARND